MGTRERGFTLIEVMIALMILAFLAYFTSQSVQQALRTKGKVQKDIDKNSTLRDALRIIERDVNLAFNYRDVSIELYNRTQENRKNAATGKKSKTGDKNPPAGVIPATPQDPTPQTTENTDEKFKLKVDKVLTQFIGEKNAINFSSLSNMRVTEDSQTSSQSEIGYSVRPCRRRSTQEQSSQCLWRRVNPLIDEDIDKGGTETVLLENVSEFSLRYLGPGREEEWIDTWITTDRGDDQTKGKFPLAVEITLGIKDPNPDAKDKNLRATVVAAIRNPNNKEDPSAKETGQTPGQK